MSIEKGNLFSSKVELENKITEYEKANYVKLWKRTSKSLAVVQKVWPNRVFNPELVIYEVTYCCVNGGRKLKSSSAGQRPNQQTFKQDCPFSMKFRATKDGTKLECISIEDQHNHDLTKVAFDHLPSQRRLIDADRKHVKEMISVGANRKLIQRQMSEKTGKKIILQDLHNIGSKLRQQSLTAASTLPESAQLWEYLSNRPGLSTEFVVDPATNQLQGIYMQDNDMMTTFNTFPELIIADRTHKVNELRMPLMLLVVVDGNGETEIVAIFVLVSEEKNLLSRMLTIFKEKNARWTETKVVLTDKDMVERQVFGELLPAAKLQICLFHTLRTFKRQITTEKMGISLQERSTVLEILQDMAYSYSETIYQQRYEDLKQNEIPSVQDYFDSNWHDIRSEWVEGLKHKHFSLSVRTTNRLESTFQKIKSVIKGHMTILEFCSSLLGVIATLRNERDHRVVTIYQKVPVCSTLPKTAQDYANLVTPHALGIITQQLGSRLNVKLTATEDPETYTATSSQGPLKVTPINCECTSFISQRLPCKHIFRLRETLNQNMYCPDLVDQRWTLSKYKECHRVFQPRQRIPSSVNICASPRPTPKVLSHDEKFRKGLAKGQELASLMAEGGMAEFQAKLEIVQELIRLWKEDKSVGVFEVIDIMTAPTETPAPTDSTETPMFTDTTEAAAPTEAPIHINTIEIPAPTDSTEIPIFTDTTEAAAPTEAPILINTIEIPAPTDSTEIPILTDTTEAAAVPTETQILTEASVLADFTLPAKTRKRGRPKGSVMTAVGLPSKRQKNWPAHRLR